MNKKYVQERIKEVEESIKRAEENSQKAQDHAEEGRIILQAFKEKIKTFK